MGGIDLQRRQLGAAIVLQRPRPGRIGLVMRVSVPRREHTDLGDRAGPGDDALTVQAIVDVVNAMHPGPPPIPETRRSVGGDQPGRRQRPPRGRGLVLIWQQELGGGRLIPNRRPISDQHTAGLLIGPLAATGSDYPEQPGGRQMLRYAGGGLSVHADLVGRQQIGHTAGDPRVRPRQGRQAQRSR
ncbi:hypothetical protein D9M69_468820 [compost metagenome]